MVWALSVLEADVNERHEQVEDIKIVLKLANIGSPALCHKLPDLIPDGIHRAKSKYDKQIDLLFIFIDIRQLDVQTKSKHIKHMV